MESIMKIFIALFSVICIQSLLLVFILWKTPALTFLKASMLKMKLMYIIGKDRLGVFKTFKSEQGVGRLGKDGLYHLTENSHTLEMGSKVPLYFAFRDLAATLLPDYPAIIQEIREKGIIINNIEDVNDYMEDIKKGVINDLPISVKSFKTYKFHDLENMFPNNLDPTFIDSTVQCEISKGLKTLKVGPIVITSVILVVMVSAIAIFIIQRAFKGTMSPGDCEVMVKAAKCAVPTIANAINNSVIFP